MSISLLFLFLMFFFTSKDQKKGQIELFYLSSPTSPIIIEHREENSSKQNCSQTSFSFFFQWLWLRSHGFNQCSWGHRNDAVKRIPRLTRSFYSNPFSFHPGLHIFCYCFLLMRAGKNFSPHKGLSEDWREFLFSELITGCCLSHSAADRPFSKPNCPFSPFLLY